MADGAAGCDPLIVIQCVLHHKASPTLNTQDEWKCAQNAELGLPAWAQTWAVSIYCHCLMIILLQCLDCNPQIYTDSFIIMCLTLIKSQSLPKTPQLMQIKHSSWCQWWWIASYIFYNTLYGELLKTFERINNYMTSWIVTAVIIH